ncbi:MAG: ROK family protein [Fimbriimonadaceae bacterium]|nr:ROK family protein [Fimbriimonadaceae bacterium]
MAESCVVGVDLGGTNVRAQVLSKEGHPLMPRFVSIPSCAQDGVEATLRAVAEVVELAQSRAGVKATAVGLAIPGHVDNAAGLVKWAPNFGEERDGVFYYWENVSVRQPLESRLGLPVVMGNDANCAALGEYTFGEGNGDANCLVMFTLGTGIGGGVVFGPSGLDGDVRGPTLLVGGNKGGAELGHTLIQFGGVVGNSGAYGPLESYCQAEAIAERAAHKLRRGLPSVMNAMCGGDYSLVRSRMIGDAARQGDAVALQVWEEIGTYLGAGVGSMINVFAPDVFAIGGQVAKAWQFLEPHVIRQARDTAVPSLFRDCRIVRAHRLRTAGILGAAAMAQAVSRYGES